MGKEANTEPARGYEDRKEMRNFVFRHLYLLSRWEQDVLVLRYGLIGGGNLLGWSRVARFVGWTEIMVKNSHDRSLRTILRYTNDKSIPLIARAPFEEIEAMKLKARAATINAVNSGRLIRRPCERCGSEKSEAHHPNYRHPLEVAWLCKQHHAAEHSKRSIAARAQGETWDSREACK